jgi:autotransporter-associated beta strand protein
LGKFTIESSVGNYVLSDEPFDLTITQTAPWAVTYKISCKLSGTISSTSSFVVVTFPTLANNLQGALYTRASVAINSNGTTSIPVAITAPQPNRLVANVTGFGPRNAKKQLRMLLSRFAFDMTAPSAITIRSADDNAQLTFNAGNSARYLYNGNDNAGGADVSAFAVTGAADKTYLDSFSLPAAQVVGTPSGVQKIAISDLPTWLQTADAARAFVIGMRTTAQNENRYFTTSTQPGAFGTSSRPVLTFVDGDTDLPPAGGAGILVVTGTLTLNGSSAYSGLILVLGGGNLVRDGGGNGDSLGAVLVARFGNSGNFLAPTFNSNGSGTSSIQYDSDWVRRGLASTGPRVTAVGEF